MPEFKVGDKVRIDYGLVSFTGAVHRVRPASAPFAEEMPVVIKVRDGGKLSFMEPPAEAIELLEE